MSVPPANCSHCGALYMRRDLSPDAPRVCNVCENKEKARAKTLPNAPTINKIRIQIECSKQFLDEVEEICQAQGISYSDYFLQLHSLGYIAHQNKQLQGVKYPTMETHFEPVALKEVEETTPKKKAKK